MLGEHYNRCWEFCCSEQYNRCWKFMVVKIIIDIGNFMLAWPYKVKFPSLTSKTEYKDYLITSLVISGFTQAISLFFF